MRTLRRTQRTRFRQRLRLSTLLNGASFMRCLPRRSAFMRCYSSDAAGAGEKNQLSTVVARGEHAQGRMLRAHVDQRWRKRRKTRREPGRALLHGRARENERVIFRPIIVSAIKTITEKRRPPRHDQRRLKACRALLWSIVPIK